MSTLPTTGHNMPPPDAKAVTDQMSLDYATLTPRVDDILERARALPQVVADEDQHGKFGAAIVEMRDAIREIDAFRIKEKDPYLRSGQAIDGFFSGFGERLEKARAILKRRDDEYVARKIAEERAARAAALAEAQRQEREARERAAAEAAAAEEARLAAERARAPARIAEKTEVAQDKQADAVSARIDAQLAEAATDQARVEAARPAADLARTRFADTGRLATARQVAFVEITDDTKLDMAKLWPFIKTEEKLRALKQWAKTTSHKQQMDGAVIEMRDEGVWR